MWCPVGDELKDSARRKKTYKESEEGVQLPVSVKRVSGRSGTGPNLISINWILEYSFINCMFGFLSFRPRDPSGGLSSKTQNYPRCFYPRVFISSLTGIKRGVQSLSRVSD